MMRGRFITFEGGDGVGKSTQISRLARRLDTHGIAHKLTREPGGTPFAERVRGFILDEALPAHPAMAEALLFAAARFDHVDRLIRPALQAGKWVLCDRFADSTRAYQGVAGGVQRDALLRLEAITHADTLPDLTLILDLDPSVGRQRIAERQSSAELGQPSTEDPFEQRDLEFQKKLRTAFLDIARHEPHRCQVMDASRDADVLEGQIWQVVVERFGLEVS